MTRVMGFVYLLPLSQYHLFNYKAYDLIFNNKIPCETPPKINNQFSLAQHAIGRIPNGIAFL